jgi:hypothetical protein
MNSIELHEAVERWDRDYEANLPPDAPMARRRPFARTLEPLTDVAAIRFQPYENDALPSFLEKLAIWISQFPEPDQKLAFLIASRVVFTTRTQFQSLQRRLYRTLIQRRLLDAVIAERSYAAFDYGKAAPHLTEEMDRTLFVPNTDSSQINSFVHINAKEFADREKRKLVGPAIPFWTYPAARMMSATASAEVKRIAGEFAQNVLKTDEHLRGKTRLVVIEDFSGTGSDLSVTAHRLAQAALPVAEVVLAPVVSTQRAFRRLYKACLRLTKSTGCRFVINSAQVLPFRLQCFDGPEPSYLDDQDTVPDLSKHAERLSSALFLKEFQTATPTLPTKHMHGFGGLALAFSMFTNCPDNSLPMFWKGTDSWKALFPRVSRYI